VDPKTKRTKITPQYLKTSDAAIFLGISRRYLHDLIQQGRIPYHRVSARCFLFSPTELINFVESCRIGGMSE
jgi:excisionase family DNA binding protein